MCSRTISRPSDRQRFARGSFGNRRPSGVQSDRLAQQVRVGREVDRKVVFEMQAVTVEFSEKASAEVFAHARADEVEDPDPGQGAERDFERAGPVDAALEGVLVPPVFELAKDVLAVRLVAGEHGSLGQQNKMLVAIDFPNELVIAGSSEVEIRNPAEVACRRFDAAVRVATPGDLVAVIDDAVEERDMAAQDFVGYRHQLAGVVGIAQCAGDSGWIREHFERRVSV